MRVLLFTGKGGVGKTTCAAATAVHAAAAGHKTLLIGAERSALTAVCGCRLSGQPTELAANLYAAEIDTQRASERGWREVESHLAAAMDSLGAAALDEAEVALLPGAHELLTLLEVHAQTTSGRWDAVVVDCGASAAAVRMLALPSTMAWYAERLFAVPRKGMPSGALAESPEARARVYDAILRLHARLRSLRDLLTDTATTSARLVVTAQPTTLADARRTLTALSLYGIRVDGIVANEVPGSGGPASEIDASFPGLPILRAERGQGEPIGTAALGLLGTALYADGDALMGDPGAPMLQVERGETSFVLSLALPLAEREDVELIRRGDELVVTVHGQRRLLTLPSALRRCVATAAAVRDGRLTVDFTPDAELWLRS